MAKTFKRLKSSEHDEESLHPDSSLSHCDPEGNDFTNVLSKCCLGFNESTNAKFGENKFLNTKNSTVDMFESLNQPITPKVEDGDDFGFQIKSGLSKIKKLNMPEASDQKESGAVNAQKSEKSTKIFSCLNRNVRQDLVRRLSSCLRFSGDFLVKELEMPLPNGRNLNQGEAKQTGKFHLICENKIDRNTYSLTVIDTDVYQGDYMKDISCLSSIRNGNPHILKYFGCWKEQGLMFIQTEQYTQTLEKLLKNNSISNEGRQKVVTDIFNAIEYCHSKGMTEISISKHSIFLSNGRYKLNTFELLKSPNSDSGSQSSLKFIQQCAQLFSCAGVEFPEPHSLAEFFK